MQFQYEFLTPDRFQEFCQALLVRKYPELQCYPVGKKDGGRDATVTNEAGEFIVFQIKFKRERLAGDDPFKLLKSAIDQEMPKVHQLAKRGATKYLILTNLGGTAALDRGSMDRAQAYLDNASPLPSKIWWRPDLDARLNNAFDLRWTFSELLTSADLLRMLVQEGLGEQSKRRMSAIESYLIEQYERDAYVKFKQADLQSSSLLALFIDVPVGPGRSEMRSYGPDRRHRSVADVIAAVHVEEQRRSVHRLQVGGATLLSHPHAQKYLSRVVIEGAPGQGKSTLAQFICQVYRMRFLDKPELASVPSRYRQTPVRVPFKVDLRDFASWLQRVDPMSGKPLPDDVVTSLESFLAAQVRMLSGGQTFTVDDMHLLLSRIPALIFLDGLDEVAPMADRKAVVEAISAAGNRIRRASEETQVIVTSRPAASANAATFSAEAWDYLRLHSIDEDLIYEYVDRWGGARNLVARDISEIRDVLRQKLRTTHVKELARNAMQLTILLNLVHVRGHALPDQRTALYDGYIDVFFNREAEKNTVVLQNRQLLIDIHGYLAWRMHAASESRRTGGRVRSDALREMISDFLTRREHRTDILDDLFDGVVQRIVAIVSRVEGTFEFEVQPLREYFAARHLYDTAPYSPVGDPKTGTKPEIFATVAPNPYWINVSRFFAGCYSVGELAGLAGQVEDLLRIGDHALTSLPRAVATSLLSDRVFHQEPRIMKALASHAFDPLTARYAFLHRYLPSNAVEIVLPVDGGMTEAIDTMLALAMESENAANVEELTAVMAFMPSDIVRDAWMRLVPQNDDVPALERWLSIGKSLRLAGRIEDAVARRLAAKSDELRRLLIAAGHPTATGSASDQIAAASLVADNMTNVEWIGGAMAPVSQALNAIRYAAIGRGFVFPHFEIGEDSLDDVRNLSLRTMVASIRKITERSNPNDWLKAEPYAGVISAYETALGETWLSWHAASIALSVVGLNSLSNWEAKGGVMQFVARAIAHRSDRDWWRTEFDNSRSELSLAGRALLFVHLATPANVRDNASSLETALGHLGVQAYDDLLMALRPAGLPPVPARILTPIIRADMTERLQVAIGFRATESIRMQIASAVATEAFARDAVIADTCMEWQIGGFSANSSDNDWQSHIQLLARIYPWTRSPYVGIGSRDRKTTMPLDSARTVLLNCQDYPAYLIATADRVMSDHQQRSSKPVGGVARRRKWAANGLAFT